MKNETPAVNSRRSFLKLAASGIAAIPVVALTGQAAFAQESPLKKALQYQNTPKDGKRCDGCTQWVPGKAAKDQGGCKVIPNEKIDPTGWCTAWVAVAKK